MGNPIFMQNKGGRTGGKVMGSFQEAHARGQESDNGCIVLPPPLGYLENLVSYFPSFIGTIFQVGIRTRDP
jgi:hypothetical protein